MESKESMGLPSPGRGAVISGTPSFNGMHQRNPEMSAPLATSASTSLAVPLTSRLQHGPISDAAIAMSAPIVTSVASSASTHLTTPPPYAITDMSTAIVPHSAGAASIGAHSAGATTSGGNLNFGAGVTEAVKKKRGRPRKYGPHGSIALSVTPLSSIPSPMSSSQKRGRGRPPGSGKNQQIAALGELMSSSAGAGFMPHAITVAAGEDVAAKIMSFSQQGPRGICILSANGAISNVTLRQAATSGGTVNYEGRFEILSLSGSFLMTDSGGTRSRTGGLSVSLAGPDGRVIGGGVAGMLMAASPVQVVVGSFIYNARKPQAQVATPSKVEVHTGFSRLFSAGMPSIGNSGPNSSTMNETVEVNPATSESPMPNQSAGAADSSNADESSQDQEDEE